MVENDILDFRWRKIMDYFNEKGVTPWTCLELTVIH